MDKDTILDSIYAEIKDYLITLTREELENDEATKAMHIMNFATNLEYAGDIIEHSLMPIAKRNLDQKDSFSDEGLEEIKSIHNKVCKNLKMAQTIFISSDPALAQQLVKYKKGLRQAEDESMSNHMKRLQQGLPQTMATSGIHMDVVRDLRRINTYVTSVAYGVLKTES